MSKNCFSNFLAKKNQIVTILITIVLALMIVSCDTTKPRETEGITDDGFEWRLIPNTNTVEIIRYSGSNKEVIIPSEIKGANVTSIGWGAFADNQLISVVIPNSVTSISGMAFFNNQLTTVVIPNSVTSIVDVAFWQNQLTSVEIGNSVTRIGAWAFSDNQLTSVVIPNSVTSIDVGAFSENQLTSILIGDDVDLLGNIISGNFSEVYGRVGGLFTRVDHTSDNWERN
jgi:hypothetical protein